MNEQFYNDMMTRLDGKISKEDIRIVSEQLSCVMSNYDIKKAERSIIVYNGIPPCVKTYIVSRKIEGVKKSTLELYYLRLRQFFEMTQLQVDKVNPNDIRKFLYEIQERSGMSDRTLDGVRTAICTFFKWANVEGYISTNPGANIKPIKYNVREREHLSEEELEMVRNACITMREKTLVEFLYSTGARVSEAANIKVKDIDFDKCEVTLFGKGEKYRTSYLNAKAKLYLKEYIETRKVKSEYVFTTERNVGSQHMGSRSIEREIKKIGVRAGLERNLHPHLLRHTVASLSLQRGMDVTEIQKMLGHENINTTMGYAKMSNEQVKNDHKKYVI